MTNYLILFGSVWVGVLLASLFKKNVALSTSMLLAFSGAFLFAICVLHLIPDLYHGHNHTPGLLIVIGFISQFLLDFLSRGVEHGHAHSGDVMRGSLPIGIFTGLFIHAFLEGVPTHGMDDVSLRGFLVAIALHKLPIAMVLFLLLKEAEIKPVRIWLSILAFSLMAPLGALSMEVIPGVDHWMPHISAFVIGILLHVSTTILYESNKDHRFNVRKLSVVILGVVLAYFTIHH
ncbi:MAG: ZIP family metal transporter [Flavobacteriia bacterium]|nr:ZIP family metal transporter [Flavobacteriia bacterium]